MLQYAPAEKQIEIPRRVYISCDFNERDLKPVRSILGFLQLRNCLIEFAPPVGNDFYKSLEGAIERCDAFVAIVGVGYSVSTWLNHELLYAHNLRISRFNPSPRICGIRIDNFDLPRSSEHIPVEWIDETTYSLLLEDIPPRDE